jgi:hypothetical protein
MKTCFKCNIEKPLTEFYKHNGMVDGYLNKCKECAKNDVTKHRNANIEKVREYDRKRGKNKDRIKASAEVTKIWRSQDKRRSIAHNMVLRAIKSGTLLRQPCIKCNCEKSVAHHEDYDKPLEVTWLCQPCHKKRHIEINKILKGNKT